MRYVWARHDMQGGRCQSVSVMAPRLTCTCLSRLNRQIINNITPSAKPMDFRVCTDLNSSLPTSHVSAPLIPSTPRYDPTIGNPPGALLSKPSPNPKAHSLNTRPTEDSYSVTRTLDGLTYHLSLTDTAGQEEYRGLWATSNLKSDAFLLVYDITSAPTLPALQHFTDLIAIETDERLDRGAVPPVKIVAGNKVDLGNSRTVSAREGLEWARARGCGFMETSAMEMVNIEETFACEFSPALSLSVGRGKAGNKRVWGGGGKPMGYDRPLT